MKTAPDSPLQSAAASKSQAPTPAQGRRRAKVLEASERLFAAQGYSQVKMEDIARAAGVSLGTIYSYFGSKSGIMAALIEPATARMEARGQAILATPPARLEDAIAALYEAHRFEDDWKSLHFLEAFNIPDTFSDARIADVHRRYQNFIEAQFRTLLEGFAARGRLRPGLDVHDMAFLLYQLMLRHFQAYVTGEEGIPTYEAMRVAMHRRARVMVAGWERD